MFKFIYLPVIMLVSFIWSECQQDLYEIDTDPKQVHWSVRQDMLLLDHLSHYQLIQQPTHNRHSLIVDTSNQHILFSLEKGGYVCPHVNQNNHVELHIYSSACLPKKPYLHILLDAGHGGKDPGAISASGVFEKDIVMHFTRLLKKELESQPGVLVSMTRQGDVTMSKYDRLAYIMQTKPDLVLSIHFDAHHRQKIRFWGVFTQ